VYCDGVPLITYFGIRITEVTDILTFTMFWSNEHSYESIQNV